MLTLSYNRSVVLQQTIRQVEEIRHRIILRPLSPKVEHRLLWEAHVSRIYYALHLAHNPIQKKDIIRILSTPGKTRAHANELDVTRYKRTVDYVRQEWMMHEKPLMPQAVKSIYAMATDEKLSIPDTQLMEILVFLQTSSEHPLIQAYIGYFQFMHIFPKSDNSSKVARLLTYLFLYKYGIHFRGLLVLEEYFYTNERLLRDLSDVIGRQESITAWIEHFATAIAESALRIEKALGDEHMAIMPASFWELTERQKDILSAFDQPGARITNKAIQKGYKISQITASRDLAKLATLGFLFPYGKGRSVYYMKV